jgi:hypothetical protein
MTGRAGGCSMQRRNAPVRSRVLWGQKIKNHETKGCHDDEG